MAVLNLIRRRRFTKFKFILIGLTIMAVLFWYNQVRNASRASKISDNVFEPLISTRDTRGDFHVSTGLKNRLKFDTVPRYQILKHNNISVFQNPALLKKLKLKPSQIAHSHLNMFVKVRKIKDSFQYNSTHAKSNVELSSNFPAYNVPQMKVRPGLGENGSPVFLSSSEQKLADKQFNDAAFNVYLSDRISLNRSVPDPRNPKCKYEKYEKTLPTASVIIIFTNEVWSALLRTIHSVINRSPPHLLHEVILVDDYSDKDELKYHLKKYIQLHFTPNLVKLIRLNKREGLIRARLSGAKLAMGDVLIFLDSHCEANIQWLEPLLQRIKEDRRAVLCPIIDVIDDKTFEYYASNLEYFQIGGFTWNGHFTWIEVPEWEETRRNSEISSTRTPTMAGGLFAIQRKYFWEIGSYDSGMDIWGGENLELSFRVWMCGGTLEIVPCSHVGHIFRSFHPYTFPQNKDTHGINTVRTVEVWMDEYKKYFYMHRPDLKNVDYGSIAERLEIKQKLKCKSFKWYLEEVYPQKFMFDRSMLAYGTVRNPITNLCLDTLNRDEDKSEHLGYYVCKTQKEVVMNQMLSMTVNGELRKEENCIEVNDDDTKFQIPVMVVKCHGRRDNQEWKHTMGGPIIHIQTGKCLDVVRRSSGDDAVVTDCHGGHSQVWWFENYDGIQLNVKE